MARKQEQEDAREEVTEVAPGVLRMELPIRMPGLGHVNCYALVDGDGVALVDPGLPGPATFKALTERLRQADLAIRNVHTVIVTHSHPDHFGGASRLAKEAGAKVIAHRDFRFGVADPKHAEPEVSVDDLAAQREGEGSPHPAKARPHRLRGGEPSWKAHSKTPWGGESPRPPFRMRMRYRMMHWIGRASFMPEVTDTVEAGDVLRLAGREFFVVHTPGHTEDHICLHDPAEGVFLAGDHVLPTITPHISGLAVSDDPLRDFFDSLDQVAAIEDVSRALPAHGHPFEDLAKRCEAIKVHHDERLEKVKSIAREIGGGTVEAFSQRLFKPRSWGAMAESETFAHLEHLRMLGDAERHEADGKYVYDAG